MTSLPRDRPFWLSVVAAYRSCIQSLLRENAGLRAQLAQLQALLREERR